jgi:hypothetical protein
MDEQLTFIATRYAGDRRKTASRRFEVAPGAWVTLFDDGRVKFLVDPPTGFKVIHQSVDGDHPGRQVLKTEHK